jgi:hypothetical protein
MRFRQLYPALILFICTVACSKANEESFLPTAEIVINSPLQNSVIHPGDTIYIQGTATSTTGLHGYEITIRKPGAPYLYFQHFHEHSNTLHLEDKWKNVVSQPGDLEVLISVILDHHDRRKNVTIPLQVRN